MKVKCRNLISALAASCAIAALASAPAASQSKRNSVAHNNFPPLQDVMIDKAKRTNDSSQDLAPLAEGDYQSLLAHIPPAKNIGNAWEIYSTSWTDQDEAGYSAFVAALGRSGCISIDDCLRSPANPYRDLEDETLWLGDCTDMVYVLRGYYAWKNGLPFSYEEQVTARDTKERGTDLRYTSGGNRITSRRDVTHPIGQSPKNAPKLLRRLFNIVSTAMLRTHPNDNGRAISSFYPVGISRAAIQPGAIAYDVFGHVSLVYEVTDDGRILLISSHPDYTVSREPFGTNILRTGPELGSGIKAWRPSTLVGAQRTAKGTYIGGTITLASNEELPLFSLDQYFGTHPDETGDWEKGRFLINDRALTFYDYVHAALRKPGVPHNPLDEISNAVDALCHAVQSRKTAVNLAIYAGINNSPAPKKLPPNIYGTYGDWERYATPSRDARLKTQAIELRKLAKNLVDRAQSDDPSLAYISHDLAAALLDIYDRRVKACRISYSRTDGTKVVLNLEHVTERLFDLSFDPFHCPEKRWGAKGSEISTCPADPQKFKWYVAQQYLRNAAARTYDLRTDFTADELNDPAIAPAEKGGIGVSKAPDVDVRGFLSTHAGAHETASAAIPVAIIELSDAVNKTEQTK